MNSGVLHTFYFILAITSVYNRDRKLTVDVDNEFQVCVSYPD